MENDWVHGLAAEISQEELMEVTRTIARWVRLSGSPDEREALDYIRSLLDSYGLDTELLMHDAYISLPGPARIEAGGEVHPAITHSFAAPTAGLTGQLAGELRPGAIALRSGLAGPEAVRQGEAAGAIAQVFIAGPRTHEMIVSPVWGSPGSGERSLLPSTPVLSVTDAVGERLRALMAQGEPVTLYAEVETGWRQTPILIANLPAGGRESRDRAQDDYVLFSGHIDSWHYGAMDNGSANATMVEVARLMARHRDRLQHGLRLAFWSGHSHGRYSGSAWYADTFWSDLYHHCIAHVNVDSVGGRGATVLTEGIAMAATHGVGAEAIAAVTGQPFHGSRVGRAGDQSFTGIGIPSLWMSLSEQPPDQSLAAAGFAGIMGQPRSGGLGWWWHTPEDTIDKIDPDFLVRDATIYALAIGRLLGAVIVPLSAAAEARDLAGHLRELTGGPIDLTEVMQAMERVVARSEELERWREKAGMDRSEADTYNQAVRRVLRSIIPLNYTQQGPYGHDPALPLPPVPSLAGAKDLAGLPPDEVRFRSVELRRARNRILHALLLAGDEEDRIRR